MALRKPLVLANGQMQQLQAGDQLEAPLVGSAQQILTNNDGGTVVICAPVYTDASGSFKRAQANATATSAVIGLVAQATIANAAAGPVVLVGTFTATTTQWDAVTGQTGGLTAGAAYFLDPATAGRLTTTAPSTTGQVVAPIGLALSTTQLEIKIRSTVLL